MSGGTCEPKRIQQNTAQAAVDQAQAGLLQAKTDYLSCLGPVAAGEASLQDAQPAISSLKKEAETLIWTQEFVLKQLKREAASEQTMGTLKASADEESDRLQKEIDELNTEIRTERRKFLDASPSVSPKVAGLYYTTEPDNQALIAFLSCFGAFLLFMGLMVIMNRIPGFPLEMVSGERIKVVAWAWGFILVATYIFFFTYT